MKGGAGRKCSLKEPVLLNLAVDNDLEQMVVRLVIRGGLAEFAL